MKKLMILVTSLLMTALCSVSFAQSNPKVLIDTSMGQIEAELYPKKAPVTVQNLLAYVNNKFYDGLVFHRVIDGFMIQGGGMNAELKEKATLNPIKIESNKTNAHIFSFIFLSLKDIVNLEKPLYIIQIPIIILNRFSIVLLYTITTNPIRIEIIPKAISLLNSVELPLATK